MVSPQELSEYLLVIRDVGNPRRVVISDESVEVEFAATAEEDSSFIAETEPEYEPRLSAAEQQPTPVDPYTKLLGPNPPKFKPATEQSNR